MYENLKCHCKDCEQFYDGKMDVGIESEAIVSLAQNTEDNDISVDIDSEVESTLVDKSPI